MILFFLTNLAFLFKITVSDEMRCYQYCVKPFPGTENICKNLPVGNVVTCPHTQSDGCLLLVIGESMIFSCIDFSTGEECQNRQGMRTCIFCESSLCNTPRIARGITHEVLVVGVTKCYEMNSINFESHLTVDFCKNTHNVYYECVSMMKEREDGTVGIVKGCLAVHLDQAIQFLRKCMKTNNCYTCKEDLCNLKNYTAVKGSRGKKDSSGNRVTPSCVTLLVLLLFRNIL